MFLIASKQARSRSWSWRGACGGPPAVPGGRPRPGAHPEFTITEIYHDNNNDKSHNHQNKYSQVVVHTYIYIHQVIVFLNCSKGPFIKAFLVSVRWYVGCLKEYL